MARPLNPGGIYWKRIEYQPLHMPSRCPGGHDAMRRNSRGSSFLGDRDAARPRCDADRSTCFHLACGDQATWSWHGFNCTSSMSDVDSGVC